jgi:hypothetical protein
MIIRAIKYNIPATIGLFGCSVAIVLEREEDEKKLPNFAQAEELLAERFLTSDYQPDRYQALQEHLVINGWQIIKVSTWRKKERSKGLRVY